MKKPEEWAKHIQFVMHDAIDDDQSKPHVERVVRAIQADALESAAKKADASGSPNDPWREAREHIARDIRAMKPKEGEG